MDGMVMPPRAPPLPPVPLFAPPPPPPPLLAAPYTETGSQSSYRPHPHHYQDGFRLADDNGSVYSVYKQKIDQMFESDSTSSISANNNNNAVQARIEKMFSDVANESAAPGTAPTPPPMAIHTFSVDYLGSIGLADKVHSLAGLQIPLKQLYFAYRDRRRQKPDAEQFVGRLQISGGGLRIGDDALNSFRTIAVWSAVKFVVNEAKKLYAFLPLVTDPDNIDKNALFRSFDLPDEQERVNFWTQAHSPLFSVVMRKPGPQKLLECHGFVCQTSEDAIVMAATLYKSLMTHMQTPKQRKPKTRNGITSMSIGSSVAVKKNYQNRNHIEQNRFNTPVRPPRTKKRSTTSSLTSASGENDMGESDTQPLLPVAKQPKKSTKNRPAPQIPPPKVTHPDEAIVPYEEPIQINDTKPKSFSDKISLYMSKEQKLITEEIKQVISEGTNLKRINNKRNQTTTTPNPNSESAGTTIPNNSGDILTKVTIPRSGSFLNAGGLTRYKSKVSKSNGQVTGGSPLGFHELFNEFRLQEGIHSLDEILAVIIDPEGMSFNDLKPIYKEFLLKLAVTLTKDELYQKSKSIMRRQRKNKSKANGSSGNNNNNNNSNLKKKNNRFRRLKHVFQRRQNRKQKKKDATKDGVGNLKLLTIVDSSVSTSSYYDDSTTRLPKDMLMMTVRPTKKPNNKESTCSEESDFFTLSNLRQHTNEVNLMTHRNSSSGYVSCSECSYDSDSCTCVSADKCYCSMGDEDGATNTTPYCADQTGSANPSFCGCDTDSCGDSNKCYCQRHHQRRKCQKNANTKITTSLEYMRNPSEKYHEKMRNNKTKMKKKTKTKAKTRKTKSGGGGTTSTTTMGVLDYSLFNAHAQHHDLMTDDSGAIYAKVSNDNNRRHNGSIRSYYSSSQRGAHSNGGDVIVVPSCKKSAEIAALFADMKLNCGNSRIPPQIPIHQATANESFLFRNGYRITSNGNSGKTVKNPDIPAVMNHQQDIIHHNTLYYNAKNLFNSRNGLYTIQSQSDESGRSSGGSDCINNTNSNNIINNNNRNNKRLSMRGDGRRYCEQLVLRPDTGHRNLENSLGYLP